MSVFDISINFLESFCCCLFIFLILSNKKQYFSLLFFTSLYFICLCVFNYYLFPEIFLTLSCFITSYLQAYTLNKHGHIQNLFTILFLDVINNFSISISMLITSLFYKFPFYNNGYIMMVLISKSIFILLIFICYRYIKKYQILQTTKLVYCSLSLLFLNLIYSSLSDLIYYFHILNSYIITICLCINLFDIFLCIIFFESKKDYEEKLALKKNIIEFKNQEKVYKENQRSMNELRRWKHDMKHIFNLIEYYIDHNMLDKAKDTIKEYNQTLDTNSLVIQCGNEFLDYIISARLDRIKENNIHINIVNNIVDIPINNEHVSIIIGNLLDNAIENCGKDKEIIIDVGNISDYFYIKVINSIDDEVLKYNPNLMSTKEDRENHGIGLNNVRMVANMYQARISFEDQNGYFKVVFLCKKKC